MAWIKLRSFKKKSDDTKNERIQQPETTIGVIPPIAQVDAKALLSWFELYGKPIVERNKLVSAVLSLSFVIGLMAIAIASMMPLKEVKPYVIESDATGAVTPKPAAAQDFTPSTNQVRKSLYDWTILAFSVEPDRVAANLTQAYDFLRGSAIERFTTEIINDRKPIERSKKDLTYRVNVSVISTNVLADGRALVRFKTKETARNLDKPIEATWALNIQTSFDPPKTEEEIFKNPIGIYIIDFSLAREFQ